MSRKHSRTTADYLSWDQNANLIRRLYNDENYIMSLLFSCGSFWGLRIFDIKSLKWDDILDKDEFHVIEKKTKKRREIRITEELQKHIKDCHLKINPKSNLDYIFLSQKGTVYSTQRINVIFKSIKEKYNLKIKNFSTHSMRKTHGRAIIENSDHSELALIKLSQLYNHSTPAITRRYLGITQEELLATYDLLEF